MKLDAIIGKMKIKAACKLKGIYPEHIGLYVVLDNIASKGLDLEESFKMPVELVGEDDFPILDLDATEKQVSMISGAIFACGYGDFVLNNIQRVLFDDAYRNIHFKKYKEIVSPAAKQLSFLKSVYISLLH